MILVRTAKIKLNIPAKSVIPTVISYTNAFNYVSNISFNQKIYNSINLHNIVYNKLRSDFNLPSQLAISVREKAREAVKSGIKLSKLLGQNPSCPVSKFSSIRYDCRSYSIINNTLSLLTVNGRIKIKIKIPDYYSDYFKNWTRKSAELIVRKSKVYLHITFNKSVPDGIIPDDIKIIGVDRGINNLAVTSDNRFFCGKKVKHISSKYRNLRSNLQKKNTKSAKRHLVRLSGREKRFRADTNHCIAKQILSTLNPGDILVLEDLTGIRKDSKKKTRKPERTLINNWSFFQLETFLKYKAEERGIRIEFVDPAYTSQTCSKCGHCEKNNRKGKKFRCKSCNFRVDADLNAARNIALKWSNCYKQFDPAAVNQPNIGDLEINPELPTSPSQI